MGDISEMRGLIVLFTIVAVTVGLISAIPSAFYASTVENPESPNPVLTNLVAWNYSTTYNLTYGAYYDFSMDGYEWRLHAGDGIEAFIELRTNAHFGFYWDLDYCKFYTEDGRDVSGTTIITGYPNLDLGEISEQPIKIICRNTRTQTVMVLSYNTTLYGTYTQALENNGLSATFHLSWDDRTTSMNGLQLVGMVLTGSLPDIHPILSIVFVFIGWGLVAAASYLAFIFVLRIVGAVFGGGGA